MSATDPWQEFYSDLDDWWAQLWAMRAGLQQPKERTKLKFFKFVMNTCSEVGCYQLQDENLDNLFVTWINTLAKED